MNALINEPLDDYVRVRLIGQLSAKRATQTQKSPLSGATNNGLKPTANQPRKANMIIALTDSKPRLMLCPLSPHAKVGICNPRKGEKSPIPLSVFFRPSFLSTTGLIRVAFVMVGCLREALGFARSFAGSSNLTQSTAPLLELTGSGTPSHKGVTTMSHPKTTQNPAPDSYGIIRASGEKPPRSFYQVCLCGFAKFSGAYHYCPQCGNSAESHSRYERKNGGV